MAMSGAVARSRGMAESCDARAKLGCAQPRLSSVGHCTVLPWHSLAEKCFATEEISVAWQGNGIALDSQSLIGEGIACISIATAQRSGDLQPNAKAAQIKATQGQCKTMQRHCTEPNREAENSKGIA